MLVRSLNQGRSPGVGNGYPLQYSWLENSMDRGSWWATVRGVTQSRTRLKRLSSSSSSRLDEWVSQVALVVKNPPANAGDVRLIPGLGRFPGVGKDNLLQYSWLENSMDRGAWCATVHKVTKSLT